MLRQYLNYMTFHYRKACFGEIISQSEHGFCCLMVHVVNVYDNWLYLCWIVLKNIKVAQTIYLMIHLHYFTDDLQLMQNSNLSPKKFISRKTIYKNLTKTKTNKSREKKKLIGGYAHSEQNDDHSETIDFFRNCQIFSELSLSTIDFSSSSLRVVFSQNHCVFIIFEAE